MNTHSHTSSSYIRVYYSPINSIKYERQNKCVFGTIATIFIRMHNLCKFVCIQFWLISIIRFSTYASIIMSTYYLLQCAIILYIDINVFWWNNAFYDNLQRTSLFIIRMFDAQNYGIRVFTRSSCGFKCNKQKPFCSLLFCLLHDECI